MTMTRQPTREQLRRRRLRLDVSLDDVCVALGAPGNASELSRWERGKRKSLIGGATVEDYDRYLDSIERGGRS